MKTSSGKKAKAQLFEHIGSAIIPISTIVAVPSVSEYFPRQKTRAGEEWGPVVSSLMRATSMNEMLIPSSRLSSRSHKLENGEDDDEDDDTQHYRSKASTYIGRMDASSDDDESTQGKTNRKEHSVVVTSVKSNTPRPASLSENEKRFIGHIIDTEATKERSTGATVVSNAQNNLDGYSSSSTSQSPTQTVTTTTPSATDDKSLKKATVTVTKQHVPPLVINPTPSQSVPSPTKPHYQPDNATGDARPVTPLTARSSLNDATIPISGRSVSFREPIVDAYNLPSSHSQQSSNVTTAKYNSAAAEIDKLPPPDGYGPNYDDFETKNRLLSDENAQLRLSNQNLQKQNNELLTRLQSSQKMSQRELSEILKQTGHDQLKHLENLNQSLQNRCEQLESELISMREQYSEERNQSNKRKLKEENNFLRDYALRLNGSLSELQARHPDHSSKDIPKDQRAIHSLPIKGPTPIWLLNKSYLAPLFVQYDEKIRDREDFIRKIQVELNRLQEDIRTLSNENISLHERLAQTFATTHSNTTHLSDLGNLKQQAYLVLEENKVLQDQVNVQTNRLADLQKTQIQEVSNLTRRLMVAESDKTDAEHALETLKLRYEELRKKFEKTIMENDHRIRIDDHMKEISEMKRIADDLTAQHASETQVLLRRVQEAETAKRVAQLKLTESRNDIEHLRDEIKATKKLNRKLQLRVQTFEKKLELQTLKEQHLTVVVDKANEESVKAKLQHENYYLLIKSKEDEIIKAQEQMEIDAKKLIDLENRLETYKNKHKQRTNEVHEQTKKQYDNMKSRCHEHEQRIEQLIKLLNEKQVLIDDLNSEKRNLEVDLESIWLKTNTDNLLIQEQLRDICARS